MKSRVSSRLGVWSGLAALLLGGIVAPQAAATALPAAVSATTATAYYVDCDAAAAGFGTADAPLSNLAAVAALALNPGDAVLFKRGSTCTGSLTTQGSGEPGSPIVIDAYGDADLPLPVINGNGVEQTVLLDNQEYWEIRNLEITNTDGGSAAYTQMRRGLVIKNTDAGELNHFRIENLYIHDVTGQNKKDLGGSGGIQVEVYPGSVPSWFNDIVIANNRIENVNRSGINMSSAWLCRAEMAWDSGYCTAGNTTRNPWTPSTGLVIRDNIVDGTGGDGIVVQMNRGALVEGNIVNDAANRANQGSNAGLWAWNADDTTFRGNTVSNTKKLAGNNDGTSFDIDYGTRNTVFEHNVSYGNAGGMVFFCGCASSWLTYAGFASEGVYRYNVSIAEQSRVGFLSGATDGAFYNNTMVITDQSQADFLSVNTTGSSVLFANNLVVSMRSAGVTTTTSGSPNILTWRNNVFYSVGAASTWPGSAADGNQYLDVDTLPSDALAAITALAAGDYQSLQGELDLSSLAFEVPALAQAGIPVAPDGTVDIVGNAVPSYCAPDVGSYQFTAFDDAACSRIATLADGGELTVDLPATSTVRITASVDSAAQFAVTSRSGRTQLAQPGETAGQVYAVVRTTAGDNSVTLSCTGGDCSGIRIEQVADVIVDGSFESLFTSYNDSRTSPWTRWNVSRSTTEVATGSTSLQITPGSSGGSSELVNIAIAGGRSYDLRGWIKSSVAGKTQGVSLGVKWGAGTEETGTAVNAATTVAGQWQYVSARVTIPADVSQVTVYCYQPAASGSSYCDDITLTASTPQAVSITGQPQDVTVVAGDSAHFTVAVAGDHAAQVSWESSPDGVTWSPVAHTVSGIEQPVLSTALAVDAVTGAQSGSQYRAVVTDAVTGETTRSAAATLTVRATRERAAGALLGLQLTSGPNTAVYLVGSALDVTGLVVTAEFENGSYQITDPTVLDIDQTAFRTHSVGTYEIPVAFTADGRTFATTFPVEVRSAVTAVQTCPAVNPTVSATFSQTLYGSYPAGLACDGSASTSWSTWTSSSTRLGDTITFEFPAALSLAGMEIDWVEKAPGESATVQYRDGGGQWHDLADPVTGITLDASGKATSVVTAAAPVETTAARVVSVYAASESRYIKVAEVRFVVAEINLPSDDATLASLAVDGTPVQGFDPDDSAYEVAWPSVTTVPAVTAEAVHEGAIVTVVQPTLAQPVATVRVTAPDLVTQREYRIDFAVPAATGLTLDTQAVRLSYTVGDTFDPAGLVAVAAFSNGQTMDVSDAVVFAGADLSAAGTAPVTVSYTWNGQVVSAEYAVTVVAPQLVVTAASIDGVVFVGVAASVSVVVEPVTASSTVSYQWFVDGEPVAGATGATFVPEPGHAGARVHAAVVASAPGYRDSELVGTSVRIVGAAAPVIAAAPVEARAGDRVTVAATGLTPGGDATLTFASKPVQLAAAVVDASGAVSFTVTIPADAGAGSHTLTVNDGVSGLSVSSAITILPGNGNGSGTGEGGSSGTDGSGSVAGTGSDTDSGSTGSTASDGQDGDALANTGASIAVWTVVAALLLALGGSWLLREQRREDG